MRKDKYVSMKKKVRRLILIVSVVVLLIASGISLLAMFRMMNRSVEMADTLGNYAAEEGEKTVLAQARESAMDLVHSKALLAEGNLDEYISYALAVKLCTENMYARKDAFKSEDLVPLVPREQYKNGTPTLWFTQNDEANTVESFYEKYGFLTDIGSIIAPIYEENNDILGNIFIALDDGYMIGYGSQPENTIACYKFTERDWYIQAKEAGKMIFTDPYVDLFGFGLMVSCTMPFNDEKGDFAGVVSIDIPIDALKNNVMALNMGENAYIGIIDAHGHVIASPYIDVNDENLVNICEDENSPAHDVADILLKRETGFVQTPAGIYYAYASIEQTDWTVVIHYEPDDITAPITAMHEDINNRTNDLQNKMKNAVFNVSLVFVLILIIIVLVVILISKVFADRITRPLILMKETVKDIQYIDVTKIVVETRDEISDLADAFNGMRESLDNYIRELTELATENERVSAELDIATRIQADMLPNDFPYLPEKKEFDLYASMQPAKKVGGDFYDFFMVDDDHLAMVMADVSGKGIPAALFMVVAKTLIKNAAQQGLSSNEVLGSVNRQLCENNKEEMFVTAWVGILDINTGIMTCSNAGHEFPALRRKGGRFELLKHKHGFVLAGLEYTRYYQYEVKLEPGDNIFIYTDGIPEAINVNEEMFGTDRMLEALNKSSSDCQDILDTVRTELDKFVGIAPQFDDMTMLAMIYRGKDEITD